MKKLILLALMLMFLTTINSYATLRIITVQDYIFTPSSLNANVGDTIKWQWINGGHTTTSVTIPAGAATWDVTLDGVVTSSYTYVLQVAGTYNYHCTRHYLLFGMVASMTVSPAGIRQIETTVQKYELKQNFPNPFNPSTSIHFSIPQNIFVSLKVYDITGKVVNTLVNNELQAGGYAFDFSGENIASGVYFYKLQAGNFTDVKRMIILK